MNNKEMIKQSVEYNYNKASFLLPFIICLIWTSIVTVVAIALGTLEVIYFSLIVDIPLLPMCIYYSYRMITLIKNANDYEMQEVLFNEMHSTLFRTIYFTVKVKTVIGFLSKDTKAMFNAHVLSSRSVENFNNKNILIGYNHKTEEVVVLKKVE